MATAYNSGDVQSGSRVIQIVETSAQFVADDFSLDYQSTEIDRTNENGEPSGFKVIPGPVRGSATLQLANSAATPPARGQTFVEPEGTFVLLTFGRTESKDGETKVPVTFRKTEA